MKFYRRLLCLLISAATTAGAQDVMLRFQPDTSATIVGRIDAAHPAFSRSQAIRDTELAQQGWRWTELKAAFTGYVPTERLAKDFSVAPGTLIRAKASNQASVLTVVEAQDHIFADATEQNANWSQVQFTKAVPVYYLISDLPTTTALDTPRAALGEPIATTPIEPAPETSKRRINHDSAFILNRSGPVQLFETVTPPPTTPTPAPKPLDPLPESIMVEPRQPAPDAAQPLKIGMQTVSGTLKRQRRSPETTYSLQLITTDNEPAFVDISAIFISDLRPFLDKPVIISGTVEAANDGSNTRIIRAQSLIAKP